MSFGEAWVEMYENGKKVRRHGWGGYWAWEDGTVMIHCKDGTTLDIRQTDDPAFTFCNIASNDWETV